MSTLDEIILNWHKAKADENAAKARRLELEGMLEDAYGANWKEGTNHLGDTLKVVVKYNRVWDQEALVDLQSKVKLFPFKTEYKEVAAQVKEMPKLDPEGWRLLEDAFMVKPAKPSFSAKA